MADETPQACYSQYEAYVSQIIKTEDLSSFKSNNSYTYMLEHVTKDDGSKYLKLLKELLTDSEIESFCNLNDSLGNPTRFTYANNIVCSPTSLRYLYHAHLALKHIQQKKLSDIVEIGGGYGGLYLAIDFLSKKYRFKINSYHIIDLKNITILQKLYTSKFHTEIPLFVSDASLFGNDIDKTNLFLISNYCFSEIPKDLQYKYIEILFPKVLHGFITWNHKYTYNFGFSYTEEDEIPYTGLKFNKFIRF